MRRGCLNAELCRDMEHAAADPHGDLASDKEALADSFCPVAEHHDNAYHVNTGADGYKVLVVFGVLDEKRCDDRSDSGCKRESLSDMSS